VTIFDRSTDIAVVRVDLAAGTAQQQNIPFAHAAVDVVLRPGVYSILVEWNVNGVDRCTRGEPGTDETVVRTTAAISGSTSSATIPFVTTVSSTKDLLGVTFRFTVIPNAPPPPLTVATEFADCEAVACAGLPTGEYLVGSKRTFCDNDEAGGGWTRLWRLNDSSCEENGWTSNRNIHANGTDPVGCRSGSTSCRLSKNITLPSTAFAEVMGKNWKVWAFGSLDAFGNGDGVFLSAEAQRLWTFSLSHNSAVSQYRCPCSTTFSSRETNIPQRINETGVDYVCDAAVRNDSFVQVFRGTGPNLCSPRGAGRLFFQKVLTEGQKQLPLRVMICKNQANEDEDIKVEALDLFARKTPGFERTNCPTTTMAPATTTAAANSATTSIVSSSSGAVPQTATESPTDSNVAAIAGAVGGSIGGLLLVGIVVALIVKRPWAKTREREAPSPHVSPHVAAGSEYASVLQSLN
jgi:hypothetical protein